MRLLVDLKSNQALRTVICQRTRRLCGTRRLENRCMARIVIAAKASVVPLITPSILLLKNLRVYSITSMRRDIFLSRRGALQQRGWRTKARDIESTLKLLLHHHNIGKHRRDISGKAKQLADEPGSYRQLGFPSSQEVQKINEAARKLNDAKRAKIEAEARSVCPAV